MHQQMNNLFDLFTEGVRGLKITYLFFTYVRRILEGNIKLRGEY